MRHARQAVFLLFVAIYLVACPAVLFQAFGYSLKPGTEQGLVKTGLIYLATNPPGATVHLGKRRYTKTTPTMLQGLLPGTYDVRITLPGYRPWIRAVTVEPEKSAAFEHIVLVSAAWKPQVRMRGPFQELLPLPGTRFVLLRRGPTLSDHWYYDWKTGEARRLVPSTSVLAEARLLSLLTSPGSPCLLVRVGVPADEWTLWIEPSADEPKVEDLTGFVPPGARRVLWDPLDRRHLVFLQEGSLVRLHVPSKTVSPLAQDVQGFGLFERTIYALDRSGALVQVDPDGKTRRLFEGRSMADAGAMSRRRPFEIKAFTKEAVVLLGTRGELWLPQALTPAIEHGVLGVMWDSRRQRAAIWLKDRLGLLEWPEPAEAAPRLRWLFEGGQRLTQVFWVYEGSHLLVHDEDQLKLLELPRDGAPVVQTLFAVRPGSAVAYDDETGLLLYLDPGSSDLYAVSMLQRRDLLGFALPERPTAPRAAP